MPQVEWVIEGYVYRVRHFGVITIKDLEVGYAASASFLNQAERSLHILVDFLNVDDYLPTPEEIRKLPNIYPTTQHLRRGWTVYYGSNDLYRLISTVISQDYEIKHHWCESEAEALAFLQTVDPDLRDHLQRNRPA